MTHRTEHGVEDVTSQFRGVDPTRPVHVGRGPEQVVVTLDVPHAEHLAALISSAADQVDPQTAEVWHETVTDLLVACQIVYVPVLGIAR